MRAFISLFILAAFYNPASAKSGYSNLGLVISPKVCMTQNHGGYLGIGPYRAGIGYDALVNYAYRPNKYGFTAEFGIGMASFRQSVDSKPLEAHLGKNALSYQFHYLQAVLKAGYTFRVTKDISVTPLAGLRYMFYLPPTERNVFQWNYVDNDLYNYDLIFARWQAIGAAFPYHALMMNFSAKFETAINSRLVLSAAPFLDFGFRTIQAASFISAFEYYRNADYQRQTTSINKGDAFGISLGIAYQL